MEFDNAVQVQMAEAEVEAVAPQQGLQCLAWQPSWKAVEEWDAEEQVVHVAADQRHAWRQVSERVVSWFKLMWLLHTRGDLERGCAPHKRHPPSKIPYVMFILYSRSRLLSIGDAFTFLRYIVQFAKMNTWLISKATWLVAGPIFSCPIAVTGAALTFVASIAIVAIIAIIATLASGAGQVGAPAVDVFPGATRIASHTWFSIRSI